MRDNPNLLKSLLYGAASVLLIFLVWAAFASPTGAWPIAAMAITCLLLANLDRVQEFSAGTDGVKAVLRQAEDRLLEVREAVEVMSELELSLLQRQGRFADPDDSYKDEFLRRIIALMKRAGVPGETIAYIKQRSWDPLVLFDYVFEILGASLIPAVDDDEIQRRWRGMRNASQQPSVNDLRQLLDDIGDQNPDRRKLLEAYDHYRQTGEHLDPDLWRRWRMKGSQDKQLRPGVSIAS